MSTTKIIILYLVSLCILLIPLTVTYFIFPLKLGRYIGLVENILACVVFGLIIALLLDFTIRRREEKSLEKVARVGISEASHVANRIMGLFAAMVKASSGGFRPTSIDELFGSTAAELVSLHLDLHKNAPVMPQTLWPTYITSETEIIISKLSEVQNRYQAFFSDITLAAIANLRINPLFIVFQQTSGDIPLDVAMNISRPVLNVPLDTLIPLMNDILTSIKTLKLEAIRLEAEDVPHFPDFEFQDNVLPRLGESRYEGQPGPPTFIGNLSI